MTDRLAQIQARADAATDGPWASVGRGLVETIPEFDLHRFDVMPEIIAATKLLDADAEFIAHARMDIPALLAMVRERDAALERVRELAHAWESRGEHDMKFSKTIPDEDFAIALLTDGAQMVENARLIIAAITATGGTGNE
jgi:hypothetical protein